LTLGIDAKSTVVLELSLMVASMSLGAGRTTVLQGAIHIVVFTVYLDITLIPWGGRRSTQHSLGSRALVDLLCR
jgi:hypothetical protein